MDQEITKWANFFQGLITMISQVPPPLVSFAVVVGTEIKALTGLHTRASPPYVWVATLVVEIPWSLGDALLFSDHGFSIWSLIR